MNSWNSNSYNVKNHLNRRNCRFMVKPQRSDIGIPCKYTRVTYEWHTIVYTSYIRMTYEYIRVTYGWHICTHEWHTDDIYVRVHTSDIRMINKYIEWHADDIRVHTSDIQMTYEYILLTYGWHTSTYEWHADDIRVHTSDISLHTSTNEWHTDDIRVHVVDIRMAYEYIRVIYGWHMSAYEWHIITCKYKWATYRWHRVHGVDIRMTYKYIRVTYSCRSRTLANSEDGAICNNRLRLKAVY